MQRHTDQRDRRTSLITLTPEGTRLAERFIATLENQLTELLAARSTQRQQTTATLITEIANALDLAPPQR